MDDSIEKKVRTLRLKLLMAERELHAASGKWRLGALLKAGHANAMNREVDKVTDRLEAKIDKLRSEIAELTGEPLQSAVPSNVVAPASKTAANKEPAKAPADKKMQTQKTASKKSAVKKTTAKKSGKK